MYVHIYSDTLTTASQAMSILILNLGLGRVKEGNLYLFEALQFRSFKYGYLRFMYYQQLCLVLVKLYTSICLRSSCSPSRNLQVFACLLLPSISAPNAQL